MSDKELIKQLEEVIVDKHKEIERLNNDLGDMTKLFAKEREETNRLNNIIKEVREYMKFLKGHYEELRTSPVEDSYFINDMLRQMFIQSIENYLVGIEDILDKGE